MYSFGPPDDLRDALSLFGRVPAGSSGTARANCLLNCNSNSFQTI